MHQHKPASAEDATQNTATGLKLVDDENPAQAEVIETRVPNGAGMGTALITDQGIGLADALKDAKIASAKQLNMCRVDAAVAQTAIKTASSSPHSQVASSTSNAAVDAQVGAILSEELTTALKHLDELQTSSENAPASVRPSQGHMNALHARFGQNAARMRVAQHRLQEGNRHDLDKRKQLQQKIQRDTEEAKKAEPLRRRAAMRAASERRARQEDQRRHAEEDAIIQAARSTTAEAAQRYRQSAARRVRSEQQRRRALGLEIIADIEIRQRARREEDECLGDKLQQRCETSDWANCVAVLNTQPQQKKRESRSPSAGSPTSLPRIIVPSSRAPQKPTNSVATCLPPLLPV